MISKEDEDHTFEYEDYYKILPATVSSERCYQARTREAKRVHDGFFYSSDGNTDWMPKEKNSTVVKGKMRVLIPDNHNLRYWQFVAER